MGENIVRIKEQNQLSINFGTWINEGALVEAVTRDGTCVTRATITAIQRVGGDYSLTLKDNNTLYTLRVSELSSLNLINEGTSIKDKIELNTSENIFMERTLTGISFNFDEYIFEGTSIEATTGNNKTCYGTLGCILGANSLVLINEDSSPLTLPQLKQWDSCFYHHSTN